MSLYMAEGTKNCLHLEGLRVAAGGAYRCPVCGRCLDTEGVSAWVREAERARDDIYSQHEGDEFGEIAWAEAQREVYRRRRVMYELDNARRVVVAGPEMVLVVHDGSTASYGCRVFYKGPRQTGSVEHVKVDAVPEKIAELMSDPDPIVRLVVEKVDEFHTIREALLKDGEPAPNRRVFYANEFRAVG